MDLLFHFAFLLRSQPTFLGIIGYVDRLFVYRNGILLIYSLLTPRSVLIQSLIVIGDLLNDESQNSGFKFTKEVKQKLALCYQFLGEYVCYILKQKPLTFWAHMSLPTLLTNYKSIGLLLKFR